MKATLATLACLLTVGFLSAAEVTGNNTAVVIRKNVVKSDNGYQFLCVPVDGLKIDGTKSTVLLSTFLPPATLDVNTTATIDDTTYTVEEINGEKKWATKDGDAWVAADVFLEGGEIFWLRDPLPTQNANLFALFGATPVAEGDDEQEGDGEQETIVFCGQDRSRTIPTLTSGVVAMCNDSSVAIKLKDVIAQPKNLDQILTIKAGSSEYNIYRYLGGIWYGSGSESECNDVEIAPGEAFYYYTK